MAMPRASGASEESSIAWAANKTRGTCFAANWGGGVKKLIYYVYYCFWYDYYFYYYMYMYINNKHNMYMDINIYRCIHICMYMYMCVFSWPPFKHQQRRTLIHHFETSPH